MSIYVGMKLIGKYLKEIRESLNLPLQTVCKDTHIDSTHLSRIENGKRNPTKEQVVILVRYYGCDKDKSYYLYNMDKVYDSLEGDDDYKLKILQSVKEQIILNKTYNYSHNNDLSLPYKPIELESRRYIGNKFKLTGWIMDIIKEHIGPFNSFFDVFAGTGSVSKAALSFCDKIIMNDFLFSNNVIYNAFFGPGEYDMAKLYNILEVYNQIDPDKLSDNYFSINFGDKFFDYKNAKLIGFIREELEIKKDKLTTKEYNILLASLIYSIDKIANTVGHFDAYIKKDIKYQPLQFRLINPLVSNTIVDIYREDSNLLAKNIFADVAYIDPPYNSRQYSRFYHIYENLVKWNKPDLFGVAMKPKAENMSLYCTSSACEAFKDLISSLKTRFIVVSYNNTYDSKSGSSKNKITLDEIKEILDTKGQTSVFDCSHKYFNAGKTNFADHKELLFITKVKYE